MSWYVLVCHGMSRYVTVCHGGANLGATAPEASAQPSIGSLAVIARERIGQDRLKGEADMWPRIPVGNGGGDVPPVVRVGVVHVPVPLRSRYEYEKARGQRKGPLPRGAAHAARLRLL